MGHPGIFFVYFRAFLITISIKQIENSIDGVLGIRTRSRRMVGADDTTELWRQPTSKKLFATAQNVQRFYLTEPNGIKLMNGKLIGSIYVYFALIPRVGVRLQGVEHSLQQRRRKIGGQRENAPRVAVQDRVGCLVHRRERLQDDALAAADVGQVLQESARQVAEFAARLDRAEVVEVRLVDLVRRMPKCQSGL